jgi:Putative peptidoglycan-binding domain-containing protein
MSNLTGKGLDQFAHTKLGTPYVYGAKGADGVFTQTKLNALAKSYPSMFDAAYIAKAKKFVGKVCCDCSGLISWYTGKVLGSAQLYSAASKRGLIKDIASAPIGAVLWKSGHVGVYIGNGYCIEEKGIDYGCVKSQISNTKFTHWLIFDWMDYDAVAVSTTKKSNPYAEPTGIVKKGDKGTGVKWVQWELIEAGYNDVTIDGDFGSVTDSTVRKYQQSCKIVADGEVGKTTINCFKNN